MSLQCWQHHSATLPCLACIGTWRQILCRKSCLSPRLSVLLANILGELGNHLQRSDRSKQFFLKWRTCTSFPEKNEWPHQSSSALLAISAETQKSKMRHLMQPLSCMRARTQLECVPQATFLVTGTTGPKIHPMFLMPFGE